MSRTYQLLTRGVGLSTHRHYHAPWSRRFKTFFLIGQYAYELQVGPLVIQWSYKPQTGWVPSDGGFHKSYGARLHMWRDPYWGR